MPANADGTYSLPAFTTWLRHADVGKVRSYRRKSGAVEKQILTQIQQIIHTELSGRTGDGE